MPTFEADRGGLLWDATAVPNAFFCEYMPAAPDSHVKVYLYGLMCAHGGVQEEGDLLDDVPGRWRCPATRWNAPCATGSAAAWWSG